MIKPLSQEAFRFVVHSTNLFALDLLIEDSDQRVLLGMRTNPPAQGYWFVPGGRVYKNEYLKDALFRILRDETGLITDNVASSVLQGLYEHLYDDNIFSDPDFNTHYIIGACRIRLNNGEVPYCPDGQHNLLKFMSVNELQNNALVHHFVKYYFMSNPPNKFL